MTDPATDDYLTKQLRLLAETGRRRTFVLASEPIELVEMAADLVDLAADRIDLQRERAEKAERERDEAVREANTQLQDVAAAHADLRSKLAAAERALLAAEFERETGKRQVPGSPEWREWIHKRFKFCDAEPPASTEATTFDFET